jgi:nucleoside-diphosphate-sugar epimerase
MRIFITGASGCIGHYIVDELVQQTNHELFLLVRNPEKLHIDLEARPGVTVLQGDMRHIERFSHLLKTMDSVVLTAAAWGGAQETFDINVVKTIRLMNLLAPEVCQQVIYFSTASILDRQNQPLRQAGQIGTDYIQTKYNCFQQLPKLAIAPHITTLFPTLVFGGDDQKPYSHLTAGLPEVSKYIGIIRFLKADGSFHFIHAKDIAQVVVHLLDNPPQEGEPRELVLGNPAMTVNRAVEEACTYMRRRIYFRIPLSMQLANFFIALFRIQMVAWDRFCLDYRHFTYQNPVNPATYNIMPHYATLASLFQSSGITPDKPPAKPKKLRM